MIPYKWSKNFAKSESKSRAEGSVPVIEYELCY